MEIDTMAMTVGTVSGGRRKVIMEGNMTIYEAAADKSALLGALEKATDLEIDLSSVGEMDTAGLQLLILVKRESLKAGKFLRLIGHSQSSLDVLDRYSMASYFGDPVVISPEVQSKPGKKKSGAKSRRKRTRS